jgi:hypothetical protein
VSALAFLGSVGHVLDYAQQAQERQKKLEQLQLQGLADKVSLAFNLAKIQQDSQPQQQSTPYDVAQAPGQGGAQPAPAQGGRPTLPGAQMIGAPGNGGLPGGTPSGMSPGPLAGPLPPQSGAGAAPAQPGASSGFPPPPSLQSLTQEIAKVAPPGTPPQAIMMAAQKQLLAAVENWKMQKDAFEADQNRLQRQQDNQLNREIRLQGLDLAAQNHADMVTMRKMQMSQSEQDRQMALQMRRQEFDIAQGERHAEFVEREQDRHWQETHRPPTASELKEINTSSDVSGILDDIDSLKTRLSAGAASVGLPGVAKRGLETLTGPFGGDQSNRIFADDLVEMRRRLLGAVGRSGYLTKADRAEAEKLVLGLNPGDNPARTVNSLNNATKWLTTKFGPILKKYPGGETPAPEAPPAVPAESGGGKTYNFDPKTGALVPQ